MNGMDCIVAGAGIWGCTVARLLAEAGKRVLVLEARRAAGGNCRCRTMDGIEVHLYGSHIFHTSDEKVWAFVNRFASFNDYRHQVLASHGGKIYHLPIGCTLLKEFFGRDIKPSELSEQDRTSLFDAFIRGYTSKQWGIAPEQVDPSVLARLKVRDTFSTDYFDDPHQGIPAEGYNELFRKMLDHPNIKVRTRSSLRLKKDVFVQHNEETGVDIPLSPSTSPSPLPLYYSGPIDALFGYRFGCLPWRSLRFETEHLPRHDFQGATVVNYPDVTDLFTRIHEFKHYHAEKEGPFAHPKGTIITREYPTAWKRGLEPYYPIANAESAELLKKYQDEVEKFNAKIAASGLKLIVGGRLGAYKYFDMDKSIAAAMATVG